MIFNNDDKHKFLYLISSFFTVGEQNKDYFLLTSLKV